MSRQRSRGFEVESEGVALGRACVLVVDGIRELEVYKLARAVVLAYVVEQCAFRTCQEMRELGGFSKVAERGIALLPQGIVDEPRGSKMFPYTVREVLLTEVSQLREHAQFTVSRLWHATRVEVLRKARDTEVTGLHGALDVRVKVTLAGGQVLAGEATLLFDRDAGAWRRWGEVPECWLSDELLLPISKLREHEQRRVLEVIEAVAAESCKGNHPGSVTAAAAGASNA